MWFSGHPGQPLTTKNRQAIRTFLKPRESKQSRFVFILKFVYNRILYDMLSIPYRSRPCRQIIINIKPIKNLGSIDSIFKMTKLPDWSATYFVWFEI